LISNVSKLVASILISIVIFVVSIWIWISIGFVFSWPCLAEKT
jgi:hypothetical protein